MMNTKRVVKVLVGVAAFLLLLVVWLGWELARANDDYRRLLDSRSEKADEVLRLSGEVTDLKIRMINAGVDPATGRKLASR